MIVRQPGVTAHAQIEDWLADAIAAGQLTPGDRLPTEHDLATAEGEPDDAAARAQPSCPSVAW